MSTTTTTKRSAAKIAPPRRKVEPLYYFFLIPAVFLFTLAITLPGEEAAAEPVVDQHHQSVAAPAFVEQHTEGVLLAEHVAVAPRP